MDIVFDGHWVGWILGQVYTWLYGYEVGLTMVIGQMDFWLNGHWVRTFSINMKIELKICYWS